MRVAVVSASLTRPANTTVYTAGDVISDGSNNRFVFRGLKPPLPLNDSAEGVLIESAVVISSANQATKPDLELWLFSQDITDLDADNAPWTPTDTQMQSLIGIIPFATGSFKQGDITAGAGGNCACDAKNLGVVAQVDTIYGVLVVRNGYTPVSGEVFTVFCNVIR